MNKNHKYIITKERKGQIVFIVMIILAIVIGLVWNYLDEQNAVPEWPGETKSYPMANANISWQQTFHAGGWGDTDAGC